jgi:CheY-like chemotaxis protein
MDKYTGIKIDRFLGEGGLGMMLPTILLVEDEETDVFFLRKAFANVGVANPVQVANHGGVAMDYLQGAGPFGERDKFPLPYLILLDLKLPVTMGLDILKWLRHQPQFKSTVVVVLTSSEDARDIDAAYALGANGYLIKPADSSKLTGLAQSIKDFWLTHNRPAPAFADAYA